MTAPFRLQPTALRRAQVARVITAVIFAYGSAWWVLVNLSTGMLANDARVYWAAGHAVVTGGNPWAAESLGWYFGGFPPTAILFAPAGLLPQPLFLTLWMTGTVVAAVFIVRRLELPGTWYFYPPMVIGVLLGNPIVVSMALLLAGWGLLATLMRPQHALVAITRNRRVAVALLAIAIASLFVLPQWISLAGDVAVRYGAQSVRVNAWATWWMIPVGALMLALARRDLEVAGWLAAAAVFPAAGFYSAMALMVTRNPWTGVIGSVPIAGFIPLACSLEAAVILRLGSVRPTLTGLAPGGDQVSSTKRPTP